VPNFVFAQTYPSTVSGYPNPTFKDAFNVPGAKCDGVTDDAPAINATFTAIRALSKVGTNPVNHFIGPTTKLVLPHSASGCLINETINATGIYGAGFSWDGSGTTLICQTNGTPCVDASGMGNATVTGLTIYGTATNPPNIGLAIGRISVANSAADHNLIDHPTITGYFSLAPFFNNQSETTVCNHCTFQNWYVATGTGTSGTYGAIWDGQNHFGFQNIATGGPYPTNNSISFNENTCFECIIGVVGAGGIPIWLGGPSARMKFINSYAFNFSSSIAEPGMVLYSTYGGSNIFLDLDIHWEGNTGVLSNNIIFASSNTATTIEGLRVHDNAPQQSGAFFAHDSTGIYGANLGNVAITGAELEVGIMASGASWWDTPSAFSVTGNVFDADNTWVFPGTFNGCSQINSAQQTCEYANIYSAGPPTALASTNGTGITISAQNAGSGTAQSGGNVIIAPGSLTGTGGNGGFIVQPQGTGGNASAQILAPSASTGQATITFGHNSVANWQTGLSTTASGNGYFIYDLVNGHNAIYITPNGSMQLQPSSGSTGVEIGNATDKGYGTLNASAGLYVNGNALALSSAPTISTGFGTSPAITYSSGPQAFLLTIGTGGTSNTGNVGFPNANHGWSCSSNDVTTPASNNTVESGYGANYVSLSNYSRTTGALTAWPAGDTIAVSCFPF
jgi:hypothetical protein